MFRLSYVGTIILLTLTATTAFAQRPERPGGQPLLRLFDTDRDGVVSKEEAAASAAQLAQLDENKDGNLTRAELDAAFGRAGGRGRQGGPGFGPGGPRGAGGQSAAEYDNPLLPKDDMEKQILAGLEEMRTGRRFRNVSTADGRLLRMLTEAVNAQRVVELGTSTGESGVWFALALRRTQGHLYTHEIDPENARTAAENFKKSGVDDLITIIEGDGHETVKQHKDPIDIVFLDADKEGYIDYLNKLLPLVRPGGLVIAHNMRGPAPDPRYIKAITQDPQLETSFLLMDGSGVGVTLKKR
jgi:predicted O-methyltransferase YrrM